MDNNIILSDGQLLILKEFIRKRGIKEEDVVHEILDHFACKTEEIINREIYLPFDRVIQLAHQSFGKSGFRPMVSNYEKQLDKMIWREFKLSFAQLFSCIKMLSAVLISLLLYFLLSFIETNFYQNWFLDLKMYGLLLTMIVFMSARFFYIFLAKDALGIYIFERKNLKLWQKKIIGIPQLDSLFFFFLVLLFSNRIPNTYFMVCCCVVSFLNVALTIAKRDVINKLQHTFL